MRKILVFILSLIMVFNYACSGTYFDNSSKNIEIHKSYVEDMNEIFKMEEEIFDFDGYFVKNRLDAYYADAMAKLSKPLMNRFVEIYGKYQEKEIKELNSIYKDWWECFIDILDHINKYGYNYNNDQYFMTFYELRVMYGRKYIEFCNKYNMSLRVSNHPFWVVFNEGIQQ